MFIGSRIKELRKQHGFTQQQLGNLINVTKVSISCYENGSRIPNLDTFIDLVNTLNTTPDYLLGRDIKVIAENEDDYSIVLPKIDIQIMKELSNEKKLLNFLRENPKRGIEYLSKKSI